MLSQLDPTSNGTLAYEAEGDIWVMILPEGIQRNLTGDGVQTKTAFPDGFNRNPVWSPRQRFDSLCLARRRQQAGRLPERL